MYLTMTYDNISWKFMFDVLHRYDFGPDFLKWVKILYTDSQSAVQNNGNLTKFFPVKRGVHQGCPLTLETLGGVDTTPP